MSDSVLYRRMPLGIDNFKKLISEKHYYFDKTYWIETLLGTRHEVYLYTRPRRFGKTLNLSMLRYFLDVQDAEQNRCLFEGLYISRTASMRWQGQYPTVFMTLKGMEGSSSDSFERQFQLLMSKIYTQFTFLESASCFDAIDRSYFTAIRNLTADQAMVKSSLERLTDFLFRFYQKPVVILIDEYDAPLQGAYGKNFYPDAVSFMKGFLGQALKTNDCLAFCVMTGVMQVAQSGIFSDLNNLDVHTLLKEEPREAFGLTEDEVVRALHDYGLTEKLPAVKAWYDGYMFGRTRVFNPFSIISFMEYGELIPYWVNTSEEKLLTAVLDKCPTEVFTRLCRLIEGESLHIGLRKSMALKELLPPDAVYELLLNSGYLTVNEYAHTLTSCEVRVPNYEVARCLKEVFLEGFYGMDIYGVTAFYQALLDGDLEKIYAQIAQLVKRAMSFYDPQSLRENAYHLLLAGFMYSLEGKYQVCSNPESGKGRPDLLLKPVSEHSAPAYVFELKRCTAHNASTVLDKALRQIEDKEYADLLRRDAYKRIFKIALGFDGKDCYFKSAQDCQGNSSADGLFG